MSSNVIVLNSKDRKHIRQFLNNQFGISSLPEGVFFCFSEKDNVYFANRDVFDEDQFLLRIKTFGLLFGSYLEDGFRLSIEGSQLVGSSATKNIFELSNQDKESWLQGLSLSVDLDFDEGEILLKQGNDFFGSAYFKEGSIKNVLPKSRILKTVFYENELLDVE